MVKKIPEGMHSVIPMLILDDAGKAITLYEKAFGAKELYRMECPESGKIMHACIQIGDSKLFLADFSPKMAAAGPSSSSFYVYFEDVDAIFTQAKQAGLNEFSAVQDMFWGDRTGCLKDSFGTVWTLATHVRDVTPEEMEEARNKVAEAA